MNMAAIQAAQSLCTFVLGLSIGFLYDLYRLLLPHKPNKRQKRRLLYDALWWLFITIWSFTALYHISWAELRLPLLIALLLGVAIYLYYFSPALKKPLAAILALVQKLLSFGLHILAAVLRLLFLPFVRLAGLFYRIIAGFGLICSRITKKIMHIHKKYKKPKTQNTDNTAI